MQEKPRFLLRLVSLDSDGPVEPVIAQMGVNILGEKILPQHLHGVVDPVITHRIKSPEVVVRIKLDHRDSS